MSGIRISRRRLLAGLAGTAAAYPLSRLFGGASVAHAGGADARRLIVFYFPDGIAGTSQDGEASLWPARNEGGRVALSELLSPLDAFADRCTFVNGLDMGRTDEGSHPGGAKKLLTATDGGNGESIDQLLARTVGARSPYRHLYLGVQANASSASGDKHVSYPSAGISVPPEDDPIRAYERLFGGATPPPGMTGDDVTAVDRSILDTASADLAELRARLGTAERVKLDLHADALRQVEARLAAMGGMMGGGGTGDCTAPSLGVGALDAAALYAPESFATLLRAQTELMVTAMACGLTQVGVMQCSHHTSELVMSRIMGSEMYDPGYDMRSHQASHYGARHDRSNRLFNAFVQQRRWWVSRFADLLDALDARRERDGTMLDHSIVVLCSEVSDGNTHLHSDVPFVIGGTAGGRIPGGRVLDRGGHRHGRLWVSVAQAMGSGITRFGDSGDGPLEGLLT